MPSETPALSLEKRIQTLEAQLSKREALVKLLHDDYLPAQKFKTLVANAFLAYVTQSDFTESNALADKSEEARIALDRLLQAFDMV